MMLAEDAGTIPALRAKKGGIIPERRPSTSMHKQAVERGQGLGFTSSFSSNPETHKETV